MGCQSIGAQKQVRMTCVQQKWLYTKNTLLKNVAYLIMCKNKNICQTKQYSNCCCTNAINLCFNVMRRVGCGNNKDENCLREV